MKLPKSEVQGCPNGFLDVPNLFIFKPIQIELGIYFAYYRYQNQWDTVELDNAMTEYNIVYFVDSWLISSQTLWLVLHNFGGEWSISSRQPLQKEFRTNGILL